MIIPFLRAKIRLSEDNAKEKASFFFHCRAKVFSIKIRLSEDNAKEKASFFFHCRALVSSIKYELFQYLL